MIDIRIPKLLKGIFGGALLCLFFMLLGPMTSNKVSAAYNGAHLISDGVFLDAGTMSKQQVQDFLVDKGSGLASRSFVLNCYGQDSKEREWYTNVGAPCDQSVPASHIIYYAAQIYGINPRVILATLQKEQSLITSPNPTDWQINNAMGYGCPTTGNCSASNNFFGQIDSGTWLLRLHYERARGNMSWWTEASSWVCGTEKDFYKPNLYPRQNVKFYDENGVRYRTYFIENAATSSLYCYTPHAYNNPEGLYGREPYGTVGMYYSGSYNFVYWFEKWFGSVHRSILFRVNGGGTYYLEWDDHYYPIPSAEVLKAYGLEAVAPRSVSAFPSDKTRGPMLSFAAKFGSDDPNSPEYTTAVHLVDGGRQHTAPNWYTLGAHGISSYTNYSSSLSNLLRVGDPLRPLVRKPNGAVYLIEANKKRVFPDSETFYALSGPNHNNQTQAYSSQSLTNMSHDYISSKADGAPLLLDGKFITAVDSPAIYLFDSGKKYLFSARSYAAWGGRTDYQFSATSINQITSGPSAPILVKSGGGTNYLVDGGSKKSFSSSSQTAWGLENSEFTAVTDRALARLSNKTVSTLVVDHRGAVFSLGGGERHGIPSLQDFSGLGFSWSNVDRVSTQAINLAPRGADLYAPGALVRKPNGAVYLIDDNYTAHGIPSLGVFSRFGFRWSSVRNVTEQGLNGYTEDSLRTLLKDSSDNKYYVIENGLKHYIDSTAMGAGQYNMTASPFNTVHTRIISSIKTGRQLTRFLRGSGPTVYYIENGQRRPFTTEAAFVSYGGSWSQVVDVSDEFLFEIPRGAKI